MKIKIFLKIKKINNKSLSKSNINLIMKKIFRKFKIGKHKQKLKLI